MTDEPIADVARLASGAPQKPAIRKDLFESLDATHLGTRAGTRWALIEGDAFPTLQKLPENTADCVVTSPPYYWQRDYNVEGQIGQEESVDEYVLTMQRVFSEVRRVLKPKGLLFLNLGDTYYSGKGQPVGGDRKQAWRKWPGRSTEQSTDPAWAFPRNR